MAQNWHEQQLDMALKTRDRVAEGRACSNLGTVPQQNIRQGDYLQGRQGKHPPSSNPLERVC
jgi:hypothetical protein